MVVMTKRRVKCSPFMKTVRVVNVRSLPGKNKGEKTCSEIPC